MRSIQIRHWIMILGVTVIAGLLALAIHSGVNQRKIFAQISQASALAQQSQLLAQLRALSIQVTLLAMDNIVDKDEGKVQAERIAEGKALEANMMASIDRLADQRVKAQISHQFAELKQAALVDLPKLIETHADEAAFAASDDKIDAAGSALTQLIEQHDATIQQAFVQAQLEEQAMLGSVTQSTFILFALVGIVVCGALWWIARKIYQPLEIEPSDLCQLVGQIGAGDLSQNIAYQHPQSVLAGVVQMQGQLQGVVKAIRQVSDQLAQSAQGQDARVQNLLARAETMN